MAVAGFQTSTIILVCTLALVVNADEDCKTSGSFCRCSTSNITLDLSQIFSTLPATTVAEDKYDITYMPCDPQVCPGGGGNPSVVCQVQKDKPTTVFSLGRADGLKWTLTQYNPLEFQIHYVNGDGDRKTIISFKHGTGSTVFSYDKEDPTLTYDFNVIGSSVAPATGGGGGRSSGGGGNVAGPIGIVLIFLALGGLVAYFVVGGIFMYTKRGARGVEVIPNYAFWKDFPFLLKDGFLFTISPCYKRDKYQGL
jgi:hypothetical protein